MTSMRKTVCAHDCPDACSIVAEVEKGRVVKIDGDPDHPHTKGFLCNKVRHYTDVIYSPLRILHPLRRVGAKGDGRFERISWDEAIGEICGRFREIVDAWGGEAILPYSYAGTMGKINRNVGERFFHRLGASRLWRTICSTTATAGWTYTVGKGISSDIERVKDSDYILIWGQNSVSTAVHKWKPISDAQKRGAKVVVVDAYRNRTSSKADHHVMPYPGTDGALALGVMHVLIQEELIDLDYVERFSLGYPQLREHVLVHYPVDKVSAITGVREEEILRLARDYGRAQGPFLVIGYGLTRHSNGGMTMRTVSCLPGLVGAPSKKGGGMHFSTSGAFELNLELVTGESLVPGELRVVNMIQLGDALLSLEGPPVKALYVYHSNPASMCPDQAKVLAGLRREDLFTVVHERTMTDTVDYADIVLPAPTFFETSDLYGSYGHYYLQMTHPVIPPRGEAKSNFEVFNLLAQGMGFEDHCFKLSLEETIRSCLDSGSPYLQGVSYEQLVKGDPVRLNVPEDWDPFAEGFPTPSGKMEFFSERMDAAGLPPLPTYIPEEEGRERGQADPRYPIQLMTAPSHNFLNSSFGEMESMVRLEKEPRVKVHPEDARRRGIKPGQLVRLFNDRGSFYATAEVTEEVRPGVAVSESIWWNKRCHHNLGINQLTSSRPNVIGGSPPLHGSLIEIGKAAI